MKYFLKFSGIIYFALLVYIFFLARRRPRPSLHWHNHSVNYIPIRNKFWIFRDDFHPTFDDKWRYYTDLFGNVLIFIPFICFLVFAFGVKNPWKAFWISVLVSFFVEGTQFVLDIGITDIDDIILNTVSALLGVLVVKIMRQTKWIPFERFNIARY